MKTVALLVLSLCLALPAGRPLASDVLGIYFDAGATVTRAVTSVPNQVVSFYLVLHDPSDPSGVAAWEATIEVTGSPAAPPPSWSYAGGGMNFATPPDFMVALGLPLPWAPATVLASGAVLVPEPGDEVEFRIRAARIPSLIVDCYPVLSPVYATGQDPDVLLAMDPSSGCESIPVAIVNDDGTLATAELSCLRSFIDLGTLTPGVLDTAQFNVRCTGSLPAAFEATVDTSILGLALGYWGAWARRVAADLPVGAAASAKLMALPETPGFFEETVTLTHCGSVFHVITVRGVAAGPPTCETTPAILDFGTTEVGLAVVRQFAVRNWGGSPLVIAATSNCADFSIVPAGPVTVDPGTHGEWTVTWRPTSAGPASCAIDLGATCCTPLPCTGTADAAPTGLLISVQEDMAPWFVGDLRSIVWSSADPQVPLSGEVIIETTADSGLTWQVIEAHAENDGEYPWTVAGPASPFRQIRIYSEDGRFRSRAITLVVAWPGAGSISTAALEFGTAPSPPDCGWVWPEIRRSFTIRNTGPEPLHVFPCLVENPFHLPPGLPMLTVPAADSLQCEVNFRAENPGVYHENVWFTAAPGWPGGFLPDVQLTGTAAEYPQLRLDFPQLDFGEVAPGGSLTMSCTITNVTQSPQSLLIGNPAFSDGDGDDGQFILVDGGGPFALGLGESRVVTIRFQPGLPGEHGVYLDLGLTLHCGLSGEPAPWIECWGYTPLDFGTVSATTAVIDTVVLTNNTAGLLEGFLTLAGDKDLDCAPFGILSGGGPYAIDPGAVHLLELRYAPLSAGQHTCAVQTGRGSFSLTGGAVLTGVEPLQLPKEFSLEAAYPNPFNAGTTIACGLPVRSRVRLRIFDVGARLVAELFDATLDAGRHRMYWNGLDQTGRPVASGTYFCRFEAHDYTRTTRMTLLR